jgi:hypothetical protein
MNSKHSYSLNTPLFTEQDETEHLTINHYIEQWTELIDPYSLNHLSAIIDKQRNCRRLRKATVHRTARKQGRYQSWNR